MLDDLLEDMDRKQQMEIASFGAGGVLLLVAILLYVQGLRPIGGALFVAGMVISALPYALYVYFRGKKYRQMEDEFPAFLRSLSESIKSGMALPQAFQQASKTDYGRLNEEVERGRTSCRGASRSRR